MARFDVHADASGQLFVDVQADLLSGLNTRLVIPLMPPEIGPVAGRRMNPVFVVNGERFILVTQYLASARASTLGAAKASLKPHGDEINAALDMLFYGF